MSLMIRTMRDKWGSRQHIIFRDSDGISKPLAVLTDADWNKLVQMHADEQEFEELAERNKNGS